MEEKKYIKISLSNLLLLLAILVIIIMAYYIYSEKNNYQNQMVDLDAKTSNIENTTDNLHEEGNIKYLDMNTDLDNDSSSTNNTDNYSKIYSECEKQCKGVIYRRETGGSSFFFIKNGVLYSGEKDIAETHSKTSGITGNVKYVVPLDKETNKTVALTDDGKLYVNKEENNIYGTSFERILSNYEILEILELPNEDEFKYLSSNGKIIDQNGKVYLDLLNNNDNLSKTDYSEYFGTWYDDEKNEFIVRNIGNDLITFTWFIYRIASIDDVTLPFKNNKAVFYYHGYDDKNYNSIDEEDEFYCRKATVELKENSISIKVENSAEEYINNMSLDKTDLFGGGVHIQPGQYTFTNKK